jgi:hypothetical protein
LPELICKFDEPMNRRVTNSPELEQEKSYRRKILLELIKNHDKKGPDCYVLTTNLKTFRPGDQQYLKAINGLLYEDLIIAITSDNLNAIALNPYKIEHIKQELNSLRTDTKIWLTAFIASVVLIVVIILLVI